MKKFTTILRFESMHYLHNRIFVGSTVLLILALALLMFFPRLSEAIGSSDSDTQEDRPILLLFSEKPSDAAFVEELFASSFPTYEVRLCTDGEEQVKQQIVGGEAECAFGLHGLTSFTYYVNNKGLYDSNPMLAGEALQSAYRLYAMTEGGFSQEQASEILSLQIQADTVTLGKDQTQTFFYTYVMMFALYMVILLYGQMVATNVATEKSSRAMELLITSAPPTQMMFGKVFAACFAGMLQLGSVFGAAFLFFRINAAYWEENPIIGSLFAIPGELLGWMLLFFLLGFLLYAFLYSAVGSTASKVEDINTSTMPLTFLFIVSFFAVFYSMMVSPDGSLLKLCSFVPFTSPLAMFTRISLSNVPFAEILLSVALLIASVFGIGVLSAKIYRVGVLLYGTTPKIGAILKAIKNA